ncbi:hypothetical protein PYR74_09930 [Acinetobacter bereziniae]|nr:hypothetical protein PYR74_09930 [Acinetobacter bereziniae]
MEISKEREAFEKHASKFFKDQKEAFRTKGDRYLYDEVVWMWDCWFAAKEHATPEGFVLVPKDELTTTYYWEGAEHTVNCVSEYEMELEKGEIAELEKWEQTKSTKAFFANIYSDEDNFEIVEFDSIEAAELAINENKAMIEAQEQSHD